MAGSLGLVPGDGSGTSPRPRPRGHLLAQGGADARSQPATSWPPQPCGRTGRRGRAARTEVSSAGCHRSLSWAVAQPPFCDRVASQPLQPAALGAEPSRGAQRPGDRLRHRRAGRGRGRGARPFSPCSQLPQRGPGVPSSSWRRGRGGSRGGSEMLYSLHNLVSGPGWLGAAAVSVSVRRPASLNVKRPFKGRGKRALV